MGRKRKSIIRVTRRKLPKVFNCPRCGMVAVRVTISPEKNAKVICGDCGLNWEKIEVGKRTEAIDLYNEFIDKFTSEGE